MKYSVLKWSAVAAYTGLITWMSLSPTLPAAAPLLFEGEDKVAHMGMYGLQAMLVFVALRKDSWMRGAALVAFAISALYGAGMEVAQGAWTGGTRMCSAWDMLANAVGAAAGIAVLLGWTLRRQKG